MLLWFAMSPITVVIQLFKQILFRVLLLLGFHYLRICACRETLVVSQTVVSDLHTAFWS